LKWAVVRACAWAALKVVPSVFGLAASKAVQTGFAWVVARVVL
jgi:hypothetical protein